MGYVERRGFRVQVVVDLAVNVVESTLNYKPITSGPNPETTSFKLKKPCSFKGNTTCSNLRKCGAQRAQGGAD